MSTDKRYCKVCREEIHGRRDKQFCSDYCRSTHFQFFNAELSTFMRRVNYTIRKNRNILSHCNPKGRTRIHKSKLISQGLNFDYFTNVVRTPEGKTCYYCYDQGYIPLDENFYSLVIKEDY